uniref:Uncharacterized protein n=1 Tax=Meloidogyne enterolobii TaxID=390850 RepID=A0A6V7WKE8_MELEN|nr:unnamed protein product [Meloidogyne enterolobii]
MNFILFFRFILLKILIFDFVNCVKENGKNIQRKKHDTKIHKVRSKGIYKDKHMIRNNIIDSPAFHHLLKLSNMTETEKAPKNFNEFTSNNQIHDTVLKVGNQISPSQNSGLYSSKASKNNPQQNLIKPTNQITYNPSHINNPSFQQRSSGFINTALLNTINANEQQKSLKSKSEDISGFETQVKRKYKTWDEKLKELNDSEVERKKAIVKFVSIIFY